MTRETSALTFAFLTIVALTSGVFSAPQTLTKCKVQSKPLILQKSQRPFRLTATVLSKSTNEYHVKVKSDLNADIRLTGSQVKFDIYLLDPPTVIVKNVDYAAITFSQDKEYVLAVSNCSGKAPARFQLEISSQ